MSLEIGKVLENWWHSAKALVMPPVVAGLIVDDLCHLRLPARPDLGVSFKHESMSGRSVAGNPELDNSMILIRYIDGDRRATAQVTEQQARELQKQFQAQVRQDDLVTQFKLPPG